MKMFDISIQGLTIACKSWGKPSNPPVLALHGWLDNANSFEPLAAYLEDHYHVVAVDLPGHGHSSHLPAGCNYHFTDGIFTVIHILNALQWDKAHILGHSMGACLASLLGGVAPDRLLSLGLIEGLGPFSSPAETACEQLSTYANLLQNAKKPPKGYTLADAAQARAAKGYVSLAIAQILCERGTREDQGTFYWRHDQRLLISPPLHLTEKQILSCLQQIRVKTHLLWANNGYAFDTERMHARIDAVRDLEVIKVPGGHHVHMETPETIASLLINRFG